MSSKITTTLSQNSTHFGFEYKYHCITNNSTPQNDLDKYLFIELQKTSPSSRHTLLQIFGQKFHHKLKCQLSYASNRH